MPVSTSDVKISLLSGEVLAESTPNDGSAEVTVPNIAGSALTATATGLPAGLSLADGSTSEHARTWTLAGNVTAAPGMYTGSVTVTDARRSCAPFASAVVSRSRSR